VKRRKLVAIAAAAATVALIASATMAGARVRQQTVRGVTDDSIKVAGLGYSAFYEDSGLGAQARFDEENENGGTHGRQYDFTGWNDDGSDPTKDLAEARRLVEQEQVFALLPVITPYLGSADYLAQRKVPFLGWGISTGFCDNSFAVGFTGCIVPPPPVRTAGQTWGGLLDDMFKAQGDAEGANGKTAAVISEDNDSGKTGHKVIAASAKSVGMDVTYSKASVPAPPATVGDYSPYVNDMLTSNDGGPPDVMFLVTSFSNVQGLATALNQAGYEGVITNAVAYDPRLVVGAEGQVAFTQFATPEAPAMADIVEQIQTVTGDRPLTQAVLAGYFSADYFIRIVERAGKNLTPDSFAKAKTRVTFEIEDVIGPTRYPTAAKFGSPCGQLAQSNGTEYEIVAPYKCYTNITLKGLKPIPYPGAKNAANKPNVIRPGG
jgi:ABC-type branched-subunit amino acid transport system substrate-binding protein